MDRTFQVIFACFICFVVFTILDMSEASHESQTVFRQRRYLGFRNVSHFFLRFNFKANMVPWNQLFAQAVGFRMNWDDPPDSFHPYHHLQRRSLYESMELLLDRNGLNGFHCVRRAICETNLISQPKGIYFKILKMIFRRQSSATHKWHNHTKEDCQLAADACPFSILEVSQYTDL